MTVRKTTLVLLAIASACMCPAQAQGFKHPGIPLTKSDLDAIKANLDKEP